MIDKYKLSASTWGSEELRAIDRVVKSNNFTMGCCVREFEEKFSKFIGSKYSVMVSSGSAANLLSIAALFYVKDKKLKAGDEVIVPAVSWATTYFPLQQYGLKVKFVDIDIKTLNYDLVALEESVTDATKLIVAVNVLGNPNNFDAINSIIAGRDIFLFEDNCESMGAKFNGKYAGTFGIMGSFSSFFSHHIATMEGGLIVTDDKEIYHILLSMRAHGWTRDLPNDSPIVNKSDDLFDESFNFILPGYNVRPIEMSGAIGVEQLKKLPKFLEQRRINAEYFLNCFTGSDFFITQKETSLSSWFGFSFILQDANKIKRKDVIKKLTSNGIECRPIISGNFTKNPVIKYFNYEIHGDLKNANYLHDNGFFVGNSHLCLKSEINLLKETLSQIL